MMQDIRLHRKRDGCSFVLLLFSDFVRKLFEFLFEELDSKD
jgi:hypothetical protein